MAILTSLDSLKLALAKAPGTPTVLEALWDGDTQGWHLYLNVYTELGLWPFKQTECHSLGTVVLGNDLRLFNGQVPPWPEVELVKMFVEQTADFYNLTLYLPSEEPNDSCPRWTERGQAIACADCHKLIIPTDSPYLPKEICYGCYLDREYKQSLQQQKPYENSVYLYRYQAEAYHFVGYVSEFGMLDIAPYIRPDLVPDPEQQTIAIVVLEQEALVEIEAGLAQVLQTCLAAYKPTEKDSRRSHFYNFTTITYAGASYELELRLNHEHRTIESLFIYWETTRELLAAGGSYHLYFKRGITYRDDSLLRFLKYPSPQTKTIDQLNARYADTLTSQEVMETLVKINSMNCVLIAGDQVTITQTGANIV